MNYKNVSTLLLCFFTLAEMNGQAISSDTDMPAGYWSIPKTSTYFKIGGYVKLDMIHDFNPIGSPDFFDISTIPTDGSKGTNTNFNIKETRLYLDVHTPWKGKEIRTYVEGDFYGTGGAFRLRHAYVEFANKWFAGQYWSNFMDETIIPPTLDFEKPGAYAFLRVPMLKYKHTFSEHAYLAVALEHPSNVGLAPAASGKFETSMPDITLRYRYTKPWGHVQLSGYTGMLTYRYAADESTDQTMLFGLNLSGQWNLFEKDKLIYQALYGPGVARYRNGLLVAPDENGDLKAITDQGFTLGYLHYWNDTWSSFAMYNYGSVDQTGGIPESSVSNLSYFSVNLLWHFTHNAFAGIEYLWGRREDLIGADGTANRLQMSVSYTFN